MRRTKITSLAAGALLAMALCGVNAMPGWASTADAETQVAAEGTQEEESQIQVSARITGCAITSDKTNIQISAKKDGEMTGTDGTFYLFELKPYEKEIGERTDYIAKASGNDDTSYTVSLNRGTVSDRLYSSFVLAVYDGTKFVEVSSRHYVTNPEAVASNTREFKSPLTKKGLGIELHMLADAQELGVKHVGINIAFHQILGAGIDYEYDGKTYHFNKDVIASYDKTISALHRKDMLVTAVILNGWNDATPDLLYPGTKKDGNSFYYMFNAATEAGFEQTRAIAAFLAERYDGSNYDHGKISNWVIGNEINNQQWNYMGPADLDTYIQAYQDAFRLFYTAIKSTSANDRVYFSLDYNWNTDMDGQLKYGGKNIVDSFNSLAMEQGQMDWGLAYHAYPCPMVEPEFWDDDQTGLITYDYESPVINFKNLDVLTKYFNQDTLKTSSGQVRPIILTEQGFTAKSATRGDVPQIQAAAYAYSYYLVDSNPDIDAYILSRQVDAPAEVSTGVSLGLWTCDMNQPDQIVAQKRRKIWSVFRNIDNKNNTLEASEFAKEIIGINKWSDVIPNFKWRKLEN